MTKQEFVPGTCRFTLLGIEIFKQHGTVEIVNDLEGLKILDKHSFVFDTLRTRPDVKDNTKIVTRTFPKEKADMLTSIDIHCNSRQDFDMQIRTLRLDNYIVQIQKVMT